MKKNIIISAMVFALAGATTSCSDFLEAIPMDST